LVARLVLGCYVNWYTLASTIVWMETGKIAFVKGWHAIQEFSYRLKYIKVQLNIVFVLVRLEAKSFSESSNTINKYLIINCKCFVKVIANGFVWNYVTVVHQKKFSLGPDTGYVLLPRSTYVMLIQTNQHIYIL